MLSLTFQQNAFQFLPFFRTKKLELKSKRLFDALVAFFLSFIIFAYSTRKQYVIPVINTLQR